MGSSLRDIGLVTANLNLLSDFFLACSFLPDLKSLFFLSLLTFAVFEDSLERFAHFMS